MGKLADYQEAADRLRIKKSTLYSLVSKKAIPHVRLSGRMVRFDLDVLDAWIKGHEVTPGAPIVNEPRN